MDSASIALLQLLLRQSDRQPAGGIDGTDIEKADQRLTDDLLARRILTELPPPALVDECAIEWIDGTPHPIALTGDASFVRISASSLRRFEIDLLALCDAIRADNGLEGPQIEELSPRILRLGQAEAHGTVFLVCGLRDDTVVSDIGTVRAHCAGPATFIAAVNPVLSPQSLAYLREQDVALVASEERLNPTFKAPFVMAFERAKMPPHRTADLVVDLKRGAAVFRGIDLGLPHRELKVLWALAKSARSGPGYLPRADLLDAITDPELSPDEEPFPEQVNNSLSRIRRAFIKHGSLSRAEARELITSKWKQGVRLNLAPDRILVI